MRVVGCFIKHGDDILFLYRGPAGRDPSTWGLPSGKVDEGETDAIAMARELEEETGYVINPSELILLGEFPFIASNGTSSIFIAYEVNIKEKLPVKLNPTEHTDSMWMTVERADKMPDLIHKQRELFRFVHYI